MQAAVTQAERRFGRIAGLKALDFGCGTGRILDALRRLGIDTYGIDPATDDTVTGHTMLREIPATSDFDVVVVKHVLEHLTEPLGVRRRLRGALHPDGVLALGVPDLGLAPLTGKLNYCINDRKHVSAFTRQSLTALLALAGLHPLEFFNSEDRRRLRCVAALDSSAAPVAHPLRDGAQAIRAYRRRVDKEPAWMRLIPVRTRAAWANPRVKKEADTRALAKAGED